MEDAVERYSLAFGPTPKERLALEGRRGLWRLALHWCFAVAEGPADVNAVASDGVIGSCGGGVAPKPRDLQPRRMSCSEGIFPRANAMLC